MLNSNDVTWGVGVIFFALTSDKLLDILPVKHH